METKIFILQIGIILLSIAVCLLFLAVKRISKALFDIELINRAYSFFVENKM